ncbi:MAG: hypothetical protein HY482_01005 [Candidatus Wildermuthbacteria bacterium]|nr:hypothetical protein [Candidatus Wildermuthbacteria bacterium]
MPLPAIAAAAGKAAQGAKKLIPRKKPGVFSPPGIIMLFLAVIIEVVNMILTFLDLALGIGTVVAVPVNAAAMLIIGGWIWFTSGQLPLKKALLPFGLNALPVARFFPFWLWSVWSNLDKGSPAQGEENPEPKESGEETAEQPAEPAQTSNTPNSQSKTQTTKAGA